ncbi:MAG: bifunctional adenosylcobinamide kinase/adenosylcobinamide-phosphate guanylyltransferase [Acidimicrobiales bacterium]
MPIVGWIVSMGNLTVVIGGISSGKSAFAESLLQDERHAVTYFATLDPTAVGVADRIAMHQQRRPEQWRTVECSTSLCVELSRVTGPALIDSIGTWVARHKDFVVDVDALVESVQCRADPVVVVTEEVGLSLLAPTEIGIAFQEALGRVNQALAQVARRVCLVVAGRVLDL